jgi:glycosyltransferase involved in cell wall biosynthesis
MKLVVVIPIHNEEANLVELQRELQSAFNAVPDLESRVIYVDDGSTDSSLEMMLAQRRGDPRFGVVELSRNFGHQAAISAGLAAAEGADAVVIMDGDLQDPPALIPEMVRAWRGGAEVVRAHRRSRQERGLRRWGFELFHRTFEWISDFPIPSQVGVFCLLNGEALHALNQLPERNRFLPGLRAWIGFEQRTVEYDRAERSSGTTKQSLRRLLRYAIDGVFSFSYKPLRLMVAAGVAISFAGVVLASYYIVKRLAGIETAFTGFTTLVTLTLFLGGAQLVGIGLVGEYLGRIYDEAKQRPLYLVRRVHGPGGDSSARKAP